MCLFVDDDALNPIVYCDVCDTGVHQKCCGLDADILESRLAEKGLRAQVENEIEADDDRGKSFTCDMCIARTRKRKDISGIGCAICHRNDGFLKYELQENKNEVWYHPFCALLTKGCHFSQFRELSGLNIAKETCKCELCGKDSSQPIHVLCAYLRGYELNLEYGEPGD